MNTQQRHRHTTLFRIVSTFIFVLLLLTTVSNSYAEEGDLLTGILTQLNSLIFGTSSSTTSTSSDEVGTFAETDTTVSSSIDPTPNPPPPPPPPSN